MNRITPTLSLRTILLTTAVALAGSAQAGFQYNPRDLVFGFRVDGGGTWEMTVDAGPVSTFYSLPVGQTITVSNIVPSLLVATFGNLDNLDWSAAADVRTTGDATYPLNTVWLTSPRTDLNTQTTPLARRSQFAQAPVGLKIDGIAGNSTQGAVGYGGQIPTGTTNSSTLIVIPGGEDPYAYSIFIGADGNYGGSFPSDVETLTSPTFSTDGQPVRADFYQLVPGTGDGTYLGYFEFSPSGVMTYHSGPSQSTVPRPTISGISRNGTTSTISFSTVAGAQYTLRYTNGAGLTSPVSTWATAGSVAGDGTTKSLPDTTSGAVRFYAVSAQSQ